MEFDVEIVLRERDYATTERLEHGTDPTAWRELDVETVLKQILLAIDRARNPGTGGRFVALRGFSWIVEPMGEDVVIAIEIPMGAAVAGPFAIDRHRLDEMIRRVIAAAARPGPTVH
ncbi:MAG TPA: hypothetical protein VFZ98_01160 [Vicinamibacterales bacterium]